MAAEALSLLQQLYGTLKKLPSAAWLERLGPGESLCTRPRQLTSAYANLWC